MEHPPDATAPTAANPPQSAPELELELHPSAAIFPPMRDSEFDALVADIREHGQLEPIWTHQGKVIDGRHRLLACKKLGLSPRTREWDGSGSLIEFVVSANLRRRHLKENQRAMIAARMLPHFEEEALKRKQAGCHSDLAANLQQGRSSELAATVLSVSTRSVYHANNLLQSGIPELIARVDAGTLAVSLAAKVAELPADEQARVVKLGRAEIVEAIRTHQPVPPPKPKSAAALEEEQKVAKMIANTQIGKAQLLNTPEGLRLELPFDDCLTEFYRLNNDRYHLLDLLDRGVFIVRKQNCAS